MTQKAIKMLLNGGTLLSEPCPYCKGVRVIKDGHALCVNCGKEPEESITKTQDKKKDPNSLKILEKKLEKLSSQLETEEEPAKQQELIKSIDSLINIIAKLKSN
ncbi:MAG: Sjogren's syndrome/scleroderma autoantigen 1 family protein [Thermoproteota archaeon]|nr:Sjogren's syndrome/scleroderma autoantigen 1 family protein [Thermoproteota archaeon]